MSSREIVGFLSVIPGDANARGPVLQAGNLSFKEKARQKTIHLWNNNTQGTDPYLQSFPWKNARLLDDSDPLIGHGNLSQGLIASYPENPTGSAITLSSYDYKRFRVSGTLTTIPSTSIPRVIGAIAAFEPTTGSTKAGVLGDSLLSITDVPKNYTQIGTVYFHPTHAGVLTVNTSVGLSYVTYTNTNLIGDNRGLRPGVFNLLRIETGSDAGFYFVSHQDYTNNRIYLLNLDGTSFSAVATASGLAAQVGPGRRALFNETSIIPLGVGQLQVSGKFDSNVRESLNIRIVFDKTGGDASAGAAQGSYYFTTRPWTHGDGILGGSFCPDYGAPLDFYVGNSASNPSSPYNIVFWDGGVVGYALDEVNQRVFWAATNSSGQSGIYCWRWKTCESVRELSNYLGTQTHGAFIGNGISLSGPSAVRSVDKGSDNTAYFAIHHASGGQGGLALIRSDLTTAQYTTGSGVPSSQVAAAAVDRSRARTFGAVSTSGSGTVNVSGSTFTAADIGRVFKINSGVDAGTYKISAIGTPISITVTTLAGGAVTFTGSSGVTGAIGDRIYLFFSNATTGAGKINYMESLAPGTFFTRTVTMTNGATLTAPGIFGERMKVSVDQTTGNVYWISSDTQQQINKYDVVANSHSFRTIANIQSPSGGTGTITNPTAFTAILANPTFDELWVGTDQGHVKLVLSDFAGVNYKRYFGNEQTTYANPAGFPRPDGSTALTSGNSRYVRSYTLGNDSKVFAFLGSTNMDRATYSRAVDTWSYVEDYVFSNYPSFEVIDSNGRALMVNPGASTSNVRFLLLSFETQYQWDSGNSAWIPKEVVQGPLPNKGTSDTISPGCKSKPIHSVAENLIYGVSVRFVPQGGATPANNEFLGRAGVSGASRTDGGTSSGLGTFSGSSFQSGDVGKLLRIESGADAGVYRISAFSNSASITVQKLNSTAFSASATASGLTYSVWDFGTAGSNAGPENATFVLADGFAKDNTQDLSGITYEVYNFKSVLHDNDEGLKFCVPPSIGPFGSLGGQGFQESFARATPQYDAVLGAHRALPGATTNGEQLLDWMVDKILQGTGGRAGFYSSPSNNAWNGIDPNSSVHGFSPMVDLGADADVGFVILRGSSPGSPPALLRNSLYHGLIADLVNAPASGGAPAASSTVRFSGTSNFTTTANGSTVSVSSGDLLGSISLGPNSNGTTTAGGSVFGAPAATFLSSHVGMALKITSGLDAGSYRITAVAGDGSNCTVRNLDQSTTQWIASASGITYEVRDGMREQDMICSPSLAVPTHKLLVERLLSPTSAQVRTAPNSSLSNQNFQCVAPSWRLAKRLSPSTEAVAPDVKNNGTWISADGREQYDTSDWKIFMDLTDLPATLRTGRYWKMVMTPRFNGSATTANFYLSSWEFYDTSGNRIGVVRDQFSDVALQNSDFLSQQVNRADFILASNTAVGGSFNGLVSLGGAASDTLTLSGGNKFLGFQVRAQVADGNPVAGGNVFNSASIGFVSADVGRFLYVRSGANAGSIYRVASRVSATQVTLVTPGGNAVSFGSSETSIQFTLHEGFSGGGTLPDVINLGSVSGFDEYTIESVNDALTQITLVEKYQSSSFSNVTWEIRRRAFETSSTTTEAAKTARLVLPQLTYPVQTGDICHDSRGALRFFSEDIGAAAIRNDGSCVGGDGVFDGSLFSVDDVGRLLAITGGSNKGFYRISAFTSSSQVTLVSAYSGAAVSLVADAGPVSYRIYGERRFRLSKYVTTMRS